MGVIKIKGPYYYADYHDIGGIRRRISLQTTDLQHAQLKYKEIIRRRNALKEKMPVNITWDTFKDKLFIHLKHERAHSALRRHRLAIWYVEKIIKPRFLADVTPIGLQQIKNYMVDNGLHSHNLNRLLQCIRAFMKLAERWLLIPKQDWSVVAKVRAPRGRVVFHTPEEINRLLEACPNDAWRLVVLLGADAGLRRGEMVDLKWQDVDFENNQLYIAPNKTEYFRYVPMTESLRNALKAAQGRAEHEYVINVCHPRKGNRCTRDYLSFCYSKIAKAAGIPSFLHKLRHTFASQLVQNGVEIYTVSKLLGHQNIRMTEIYAHLAPHTLHMAVLNLPKRGMQLVGTEEKTVCEENKACRQISVNLGNLMWK